MKITEAQLRKIIKEELEAVLGEEHTWPEEEDSGESEEEIAEKKKYQKSFYKAKDDRADYLISKGVDSDVAYGVADKQMAKAGKKKRKKKRGKKWWHKQKHL